MCGAPCAAAGLARRTPTRGNSPCHILRGTRTQDPEANQPRSSTESEHAPSHMGFRSILVELLCPALRVGHIPFRKTNVAGWFAHGFPFVKIDRATSKNKTVTIRWNYATTPVSAGRHRIPARCSRGLNVSLACYWNFPKHSPKPGILLFPKPTIVGIKAIVDLQNGSPKHMPFKLRAPPLVNGI